MKMKINLSLDEDVVGKLRGLAESSHRSISQWVTDKALEATNSEPELRQAVRNTLKARGCRPELIELTEKGMDRYFDFVKEKNGEVKESPFTNFAQVNLDYTGQIIQLAQVSSKAVQVFVFLVERMDDNNAFICSSAVIQEALDMSRASVSRAVKILKDSNLIDIKKFGTTNVYLINSQLVWKTTQQKEYDVFG